MIQATRLMHDVFMMENLPSIIRFGFLHECLAKSKSVNDSFDSGQFINAAVKVRKLNTTHFRWQDSLLETKILPSEAQPETPFTEFLTFCR